MNILGVLEREIKKIKLDKLKYELKKNGIYIINNYDDILKRYERELNFFNLSGQEKINQKYLQ